jgi:hypothetical protein
MSIEEPTELSQWQSRIYRRTLLVVVSVIALLTLLGLGVGLAIVQISSDTELSLSEVWTRAQPQWILVATLCVLLGTASHGPRMRPLLPPSGGESPGIPQLGSLYLAASVLNLSFPGPAGELAAGVVLQRTHRIPATLVIAASLHARFVALLVSALLTLLCLPFLSIPEALQTHVYLGAGVLGLGGTILGLLSFSPHQLKKLSGATIGRLGRADGGLIRGTLHQVHDKVDEFAQALATVPRQGFMAYLNAALWSVGSLTVSFLAIMCAAQSFGISPEPIGTFMTLCLTLIAAVALIVVPGGLGSFDLVLVTALTASAGTSWTEACLILWGVRLAQILSIALALLFFRAWARDFLQAEVLQKIEKGGTPSPAP